MEINRLDAYEELRRNAWNGYWGKRILSELGFLLEVSLVEDTCYDALLLPQIESLREAVKEHGTITKSDALAVETALSSLQPAARAYEVACAAHAHIDMNWMWGFQETASLTIDTFRTILDLMKEYPTFTFSQSQASVYHIVEQYCPAMLDEIRRRVHEGRWEVTASSWVENDKNLSGGEAMARHLLYTRRYLSDLLQIPQDSIQLDFEPDTFGHCAHLPEILNQGGVRYYYHCRGMDSAYIYNWKAPSGAEVLVYREPTWYNQAIEYDVFSNVPGFCKEYGTKQYLKVYGVGDHGGGPTRRDLDRIIDMASWPLLPTIQFGTIQGFFKKLELDRKNFPVIDEELNYVFTGCYTTQARIKKGNRLSEERLAQAEFLDVAAKLTCKDYKTPSPFEPAWRRVLFNQFHDILPGSGVVDTREYAMGEYQKALSVAMVNGNHAMRTLCQSIDTTSFFPDGENILHSACGVGFGTEFQMGYGFAASSSMGGNQRVYTLFNTSQYPWNGATELILWDWPDDAARMEFFLEDGTIVPSQLLEEGTHYWTHHFHRVVVNVEIPAYGYRTIGVRTKTVEHIQMLPFLEPRVDRITDEPIVLENKYLSAVFHPGTMTLLSLVDKIHNQELVTSGQPAGIFQLAMEDTAANMTSWRVGHRGAVQNLNELEAVTVNSVTRGSVRQEICFSFAFGASALKASVALDADSPVLRYNLNVNWKEFGSEKNIPQLSFCLPVSEKMPVSMCRTPMGVTYRPALAQDVPCQGLIVGVMDNGQSVGLMSDCKYGFRNDGNTLSVTLIRSAFDPDQTPEIGMHTVCVGIAVGDKEDMLKHGTQFVQLPCASPSGIHTGTEAPSGSYVTVENAQVSCIKKAEDTEGIVVRLYNHTADHAQAAVTFANPVANADCVNICEQPATDSCVCNGNQVAVELPHHRVSTIRVNF